MPEIKLMWCRNSVWLTKQSWLLSMNLLNLSYSSNADFPLFSLLWGRLDVGFNHTVFVRLFCPCKILKWKYLYHHHHLFILLSFLLIMQNLINCVSRGEIVKNSLIKLLVVLITFEHICFVFGKEIIIHYWYNNIKLYY